MSNELYHWGILGMKWGQRRYRNSDGTLTSAGKKRYNRKLVKEVKRSEMDRKRDIHQIDPTKLDDETLQKYTNRLNMENNWLTAVENYDKHNPNAMAYARNIVDRYGSAVVNSMVNASATSSAKVITNAITKGAKTAAAVTPVFMEYTKNRMK